MKDESWPYETTTIKSCCNGLILMCGVYHNRACDYYVCNPTTNARFKLPQIPDDVSNSWGMCLAFDPSNSPHYKVVCVPVEDTDMFEFQFRVYSSETGCWRKSHVVEPFEASVHFDRGVYWNGAIHWVSYDKTRKSIYFDPDNDRMSREMMPTTPALHKISRLYYFGESCGHLYYAWWSYWAEIELDVYEMRRDYSEWFVKYRIRDPFISVGHCRTFLCAVVRGKTTHHDDSYSIFLIGGTLVRYNFLNETRETKSKVLHSRNVTRMCIHHYNTLSHFELKLELS